jgi:hypothetical protein
MAPLSGSQSHLNRLSVEDKKSISLLRNVADSVLPSYA